MRSQETGDRSKKRRRETAREEGQSDPCWSHLGDTGYVLEKRGDSELRMGRISE